MLLVGPARTGKSRMLEWANGSRPDDVQPTCGVDFVRIRCAPGSAVWDVGGSFAQWADWAPGASICLVAVPHTPTGEAEALLWVHRVRQAVHAATPVHVVLVWPRTRAEFAPERELPAAHTLGCDAVWEADVEAGTGCAEAVLSSCPGAASPHADTLPGTPRGRPARRCMGARSSECSMT